MKSSGGGRKRGRPVSLTPEQKRKKAQLRQARHRRRVADEQWARATNSGRIIYLDVLHWLDLLEFLVALKALDPKDVENPPAIDDAVHTVLWWKFAEILARREAWERGSDYTDHFPFHGPDPRWRPTCLDSGTARFKVTHEVADILDLDIDDERGIKQCLEDHLFRLYSDIHQLRPPDKVGIAWGNRNYGRHRDAFEEEASEAQQRFERHLSASRPTSAKGIKSFLNRLYSSR